MTNKEINTKKLLQRMGEDTSYTFKGLYKTSDWLEISRKLYLLLPLVLSIVCLGFDSIIPQIILKIISLLSLIGTLILLIEKNLYKGSRIEQYRVLANKFKKLYDEIERNYYKEDYTEIDNLHNQINELGKEVALFPISLVGRIWSKRKIKQEMNLQWINEENLSEDR